MPRRGSGRGGIFSGPRGQIELVAIKLTSLIEHVQASGSEGGLSAAADAQFTVDAARCFFTVSEGNTKDVAISRLVRPAMISFRTSRSRDAQ